jgi:hypothetical protein
LPSIANSSLGTSVIVENISVPVVHRSQPGARVTPMIDGHGSLSATGRAILKSGSLPVAVRYRDGFPAGGAPYKRAVDDDRKPENAGADLKAAISWLKDHADSNGCHRRSRQRIASVRDRFSEQDTDQLQTCALSGNAPAVQDVLGSQVDIMCGEASGMLPHVRGGTVKAYAVMAEKRWFAAPDIPTKRRSWRAGSGDYLLARHVGRQGHTSRNR